MTTQAQIEAVRKMLQLSSCFGKEVCVMWPCACAETLIAAAQVGLIPFNHPAYIATIERCAQVAEDTVYASDGPLTARLIAAAIRKLKDAP